MQFSLRTQLLFTNATRAAKSLAGLLHFFPAGLAATTPRPRRGSARRQPASIAMEAREARSMMAVVAAQAPLPVESFDGTGNNLAHLQWGSTDEQLLRKSPVAYADGIAIPAGADRPSARLVSNLLAASPVGGITNDREFTAMEYAWGQFLDHDLGLTTTGSPRESFSIAVPAGDPAFDPAGTGAMTISMSRSTFDPATGISTPRQQLNSVTAFIDGSQVYGVDAERNAALREHVGGRMLESAGGLLPFNTAGLANANDAHVVADSNLFLAGDVRANENPELLALQTLFVREHNRIAATAALKNPTWSDEQLFQHARRIVIAELQQITYNEFLPALLGSSRTGAAGIAAWSGYRPNVNPGLTTEFSTAAFRLGHSMLGEDIQFLDNNGIAVRDELRLKDSFFDPTSVTEVGIEPLLKYLASDRAQEIDTKVVDDVRNFLFGAPGQGGFDLAALNIQRGRDHGLADYNSVRAAYGLKRVTSFAEITPDVAVQQALQQAYGNVNSIDLWVGGLAEKHLAGSSLGETFSRILVDQFSRLRDGDRFWYQNVLPAGTVAEIQKTTLADIIARNTHTTNLQPNVFFFHASIGGTVFSDGNADSRRQAVERGVAGATVTLLDAAGSTVATTLSDAQGNYRFTGLDLGTFRVSVALATPGGGSNASATSRSVSLTRGGEERGVDVGLRPVAPPAVQSQPTRTAVAPPAARPAAPQPLPQTLAAAASVAAPKPSPLSGPRRR